MGDRPPADILGSMLRQAIGQTLPLGIGVSLSPVPVIAVVLMMSTPRARSTGPAFLLGWLSGLILVGTAALVIAGGEDASNQSSPATWVSIVKLVLGATLALLAVRQWRRRPRTGSEVDLPGWMAAIDRFSSARSFGLGAGLSSINPKNLMLTLAAAAAIAGTGAPAGGQAIALALFVVLATLGPGVPVGIYLALGDRAPGILGRLKRWLGLHNTAIMSVVLLLIAVKLLGDGIASL